MRTTKSEVSQLATHIIREAVQELRGEVVVTVTDAKRADARGLARLGADLRQRASRLNQLAAMLEDLLQAFRPPTRGAA